MEYSEYVTSTCPSTDYEDACIVVVQNYEFPAGKGWNGGKGRLTQLFVNPMGRPAWNLGTHTVQVVTTLVVIGTTTPQIQCAVTWTGATTTASACAQTIEMSDIHRIRMALKRTCRTSM